MKRLLALFLLLTILLSICGCHPSETLNTPPASDPSGSTGHSQPKDPTTNSQPEDPTETTGSQPEDPTETTAASQPEEPAKSIREQIEDDEIRAFHFDGEQPFYKLEIDISSCVLNNYYFYNEITGELTDVFEFPVLHIYKGMLKPDSLLYYVKESNPNAIYVTDVIGEVHTLCYASEAGKITHFAIGEESDDMLDIVLNEKQFIRFNMNTEEEQMLLDVFYIRKAYWYEGVMIGSETHYNTVYWVGKLDENDETDEYLYLTESNEVIEWPYL